MTATKPSSPGVRRPVDLVREHGLSTQAVRNYERDGVLPPAERSPSGYRRFTEVHARALSAYLALIPGHGYAAGREIMRAVNRGEIDTALRWGIGSACDRRPCANGSGPGILQPVRDPATRYRVYSPDDVRDAELAHLLRRGGYRLDHIAGVLRRVREAGGTEPLAASLHQWRERLTERGRAMLTGAARLAEYIDLMDAVLTSSRLPTASAPAMSSRCQSR